LININLLFLITSLTILVLDIIRKIIPILALKGYKKTRVAGKIFSWIELFALGYLMTFLLVGKIYIFIIVIFFIFFLFLWPSISNVLIYLTFNRNKKKNETNDIKDKINDEFNNSIDANKEKDYSKKTSDIHIKEVLKVFTKNFFDIKSSDDIFNQLPKEKFIDITNSNEIKELNAMNDKRITNKFYKFDEINSEVGELDIDFFNKEFANIRIQLFDNDYSLKQIKEYIDNSIIINWDYKKVPFGMKFFYKYVGKTKNDLIVGIKKVGLKEAKKSISITITDKKYGNVKYFV